MILASAGSGKTYALTNRFVALLARGAAPERIVALTFTRKAAGEFFDEILNKLARAASDPAAAGRLAASIEAPGLGSADFLKMLRSVVDAMPRLSLGTLDGFFARIVRSFPLELGLSGDFEILQEHSARRERRRVLRSLFTASGEPDASQREFIEAFKRATFGLEEKQLGRRLDSFLDGNAEIFLAAPKAAVWGEAAKIWPAGAAWFAGGAGGDEKTRRSEAEKALRAALPWAALNDLQKTRLEAFFVQLPEWSAGAPLPSAVEYLLKNAFKVWDDLRAGRADLTVERRKVGLTPEACRALVGIVEAIVGAELQRRLEMTRGLFAVLRGYERIYHDAVRRGGRLTFADVQRLLLPAAGGPALASGRRRGDGDDTRLAIDWRLDTQFDHWLLDEFQDTSFAQWSVLRNLVDEAVQDPEGRRSFFYVGDVKQAIFSWREGDPRLFREIFDHYNRGGANSIDEVQLNRSWRSGPAVIDLVNRVFGDARALAQIVPAETARTWTREWQPHTTAHPDLQGYASVALVVDETARFAETLRILQEVTPLERGLSVAVLVQKNDTGARLADYLRREGGLRAVAESDLTVCTDNPLGAALLALLRAATLPGDTLAWEHVRMTPLATVLADRGILTRDALTAQVLGEIHERGFAATMARWLNAVESHLSPDDGFSRVRGRQWLDAAHRFDETGGRDVAEFLEFAGRHTVREADTAAVVRVLTVHKSKGLGFDLAILPDLEGTSLAQRRRGLAVKKAADRSVDWVLDLPSQAFAERDEVLAAYLTSAEEDAAYESLCRLYVAMTRAKRAMYLVVENLGDSESKNFPQLLRETVGETYADGDRDWYRAIVAPPPSAEQPDSQPGRWVGAAEGRGGRRSPRLPARTPSGTERASIAAPALFALDGRTRAEFGTAVHARFAEIEWREASLPAWMKTSEVEGDDVEGRARAEVRACVQAPALAEAFSRPSVGGSVEVWRERAFEIVIERTWITGVFDRVVVTRDSRGRAVRAAVWDFKTDRVADRLEAKRAAVRYEGQLLLYRRAAARLTGVGESEVTASLVFTAIRETVVPAVAAGG